MATCSGSAGGPSARGSQPDPRRRARGGRIGRDRRIAARLEAAGLDPLRGRNRHPWGGDAVVTATGSQTEIGRAVMSALRIPDANAPAAPAPALRRVSLRAAVLLCLALAGARLGSGGVAGRQHPDRGLARGGRRSGGAARGAHHRARARGAADGGARGDREAARGGRDPRVRDGHLRGQDGDDHREPDEPRPSLSVRAGGRGRAAGHAAARGDRRAAHREPAGLRRAGTASDGSPMRPSSRWRRRSRRRRPPRDRRREAVRRKGRRGHAAVRLGAKADERHDRVSRWAHPVRQGGAREDARAARRRR